MHNTMNEPAASDFDPLVEALRRRVAAEVARTQEGGTEAFAAVDPEQAHREADRLARVLRAQRLLEELMEVLQALELEDAPMSAAVEVARPPLPRGGPRLPNGPALHREALADPVLAALRAHGGTASLQQIWSHVEGAIRHRFTRADLDGMPSRRQEARWMYNVRWTLTDLKNAGRVERTAKRGVWRLLH